MLDEDYTPLSNRDTKVQTLFMIGILQKPSGTSWDGLDKMLSQSMDPADKKTLWKAVASAVEIISMALTAKNIHSAFDSTGSITRAGVCRCQEEMTNDPSSPLKILQGNKFWSEFQGELPQQVLDLVPTLSLTVRRHNFIPETVFDEVLDALPGADNVQRVKPGNMELNDKSINKQRCSILDQPFFRVSGEASYGS